MINCMHLFSSAVLFYSQMFCKLIICFFRIRLQSFALVFVKLCRIASTLEFIMWIQCFSNAKFLYHFLLFSALHDVCPPLIKLFSHSCFVVSVLGVSGRVYLLVCELQIACTRSSRGITSRVFLFWQWRILLSQMSSWQEQASKLDLGLKGCYCAMQA